MGCLIFIIVGLVVVAWAAGKTIALIGAIILVAITIAYALLKENKEFFKEKWKRLLEKAHENPAPYIIGAVMGLMGLGVALAIIADIASH